MKVAALVIVAFLFAVACPSAAQTPAQPAPRAFDPAAAARVACP